MKKFKKLIIATTALTIGLGGLLATTPSFAYGHYRHYRHYYRHDQGAAIAGGLITGAALGVIIAGSMGHPTYYGPGYYNNCRQVFVSRRCYRNNWGGVNCYRVRHVRYVC